MAVLGKLKSRKKSKIEPQRLRIFNLIAGIVCLVQGVLILILSDAAKSSEPIFTSFLARDTASSQAQGQDVFSTATRLLFDLNLAYLVAAFLIISSAVYLLSYTVLRRSYESSLKAGFNKFRWIDLATSLGLAMVAVSILAGVSDISSLIMILSLTVVLGVAGALADKYSLDTKSVKWWPYLEGIKFVLIPWLVLLFYGVSAVVYGSALPTYLYFVLATVLVFLACLLINSYLMLRRMGHWENELFGEKVYIILSVLLKSSVAWQIFAGTLR